MRRHIFLLQQMKQNAMKIINNGKYDFTLFIDYRRRHWKDIKLKMALKSVCNNTFVLMGKNLIFEEVRKVKIILNITLFLLSKIVLTTFTEVPSISYFCIL
jgi:hypothetical protein